MHRLNPYLSMALFLVYYSSAASAAEQPLFTDTALLELRLELPISTLRKADRLVPHSGEVVLPDGARLKAKFSKRGHSRLETCSVPPLWVDLAKTKTGGTVFEGQNRLKLVTPCRESSTYENLLVSEYLNYRIFNLVSDMSYRVRLAKVTYRDSDNAKRRDRGPYFGFFIEHKRGLRARTGLESVNSPQINPRQLDPEWAVRFEVFAYMISHTDWSIIGGGEGSGCCHNGHLFAPPGWEGAFGQVVPVGYDFDLTGSVNPPYGEPPLRLRNWKHRLYRGRCWDKSLIDETIDEVSALKDEIRSLVLVETLLSEKRRKSMWSFIDSFFIVAGDPEKRQKWIHDKCRPLP